MPPLSPEQLATLLRAAERAHSAYEDTLGHHDEDWPRWYAEYVLGALEADESAHAGRHRPVTLTGRFVELRPLTRDHTDSLVAIGLDPALWRYTVNQVKHHADMKRYVETALEEQAAGRSLPFVTISRSDGRVVGSTRYGNIDRHHRRVEIGWTWVAVSWQRTPINTEAKLLLLRHAFESLGCVRVEFKTDRLNEPSRAALRRIGAVEEGIFRRHMITDTGRWRDSVCYSIVAEEWPAIRAGLEARLAR